MRNVLGVGLVGALLVLGCGTRFPAREPDPRVGAIRPAKGPAGGGTLLVVEGLAFQAGARVFFGEVESPKTRFVSSTLLTAETPPGALGAISVSVVNPDELRAVVEKGFSYQDALAGPGPIVDEVYPGAGPASGGTVGEVHGSGFEDGLMFFVGGVPAIEPTRVSDNVATGVFPAGEAGAADLAVTNSDGRTAWLRQAFTFSAALADAPPAINGVLPRGSSAAGGAKGTVTGTGFKRGVRVYVGGRPAPTVFQADELLEITVPAGTPGRASVAVTNPDGQAAWQPAVFIYYHPSPLVAVVAPENGPVAGGTEVTLIGGNFTPDTVVSFGTRPAQQVLFDEPRKIRAITPPALSWGPIDVIAKNRDGQEDVRSGAFFYYDAEHAPREPAADLSVDHVLPSSGPTTGGTAVLVIGKGFTPGSQVRFGGTLAESQRLSASTLSVRAPAAPAGPTGVTVTRDDGGSETLALGFIYFDPSSPAPAAVTSAIQPSTGPIQGGSRGLLSGRNFVAGAELYFGATPAARTVVLDASRISFVTPPHETGLVDVTVVNPDGRSGRMPLGFAFYDVPGASPIISALDPVSAPAGAEAEVALTGAELQPGLLLFLGDWPASNVLVTNPGELTALLPALGPGGWDVTVTNPDGRYGVKEQGFRYTTPTPSVIKLTPAVGSIQGGERIVVLGANFLAGSHVLFGLVESSDVLFLEPGALLATSPPGAVPGKVDVTVENPGGGSGTLAQAFEYKEGYTPQPPPAMSGLIPPTGPSSGSTVALLRGSGFQEGMRVLFGVTSARKVLVGKSTEAVIVTPAGAVGPSDVTLINPDGQVGGLSGAFIFTDPNTLPPGPVLTGVIPNQGPETSPTDILLTGRRFAQGTMVFVGAFVTPFARRDSDTLMSSRAPPGQKGPVDVAVTNPQGQSSILENGFTYRAAPVVQTVDPDEAPDSGGRQLQIFGQSFEPGSRVFFGQTPAQSVTYVGDTLLIAVTPPANPGLVDLIVENPDGQEGVLEGGFTFRAPPRVTSLVPAQGPVTGNTIAAVVGADFLPGATVLFDGATVETGYGDERTLVVKTPIGAFAGQEINVTVRNPDLQTGQLARGFAYTNPALFTTPDPILSAVKPPTGPETGGTYALLEGSHWPQGTVAFFGNRLMSRVRVVFSNKLTGVTPGGPRGPVRVAITTPEGRSAQMLSSFTFTDPLTLAAAPTVASLNPRSGITRGGEDVSIGGTGFATSGVVLAFLNGFPAASVTAIASGALTVRTGPGLVGQGDVAVTNPNGRSATLANYWTYESTAPSFESSDPVRPGTGPTVGGTNVRIRGTDFEFGAEVRFGTALGTAVVVESSTELRVRTPPGPIGKVAVTVINPGGKNGTIPDGFEFIPPPLILTVTPASGAQAGGNAVAVNGRYFRDAPVPLKLFIGNIEALSVRMETSTVITGVVPAGTGTAAVKVVNGDGQQGDLASGYVYLPSIVAPSIVAVSPDNGAALGGTYVTVVGGGFIAGAKVFFGDAEAAEVQVMSAGALTCRVPAGTENTTVPVTVKNPPHPGGTEVTKAGAFLYRPGATLGELKLTFVSPQQGPCAGGTELLIGGQGIQTGAKVYLDTVLQDNIRVYGPTSVGARTKAYGDPATCPRTPVAVKVENPNLESFTLGGTQGFVYAGGNRRYSYADGDRTPPESLLHKTFNFQSYNAQFIPVIARFTRTVGGGKNLADILFGRFGTETHTGVNYSYDPGNFLFYTPSFKVNQGVFWNDSSATMKRYDPACTPKVRTLGRNCADTQRDNTSNAMFAPVVADFDLNLWPDVLFYENAYNSFDYTNGRMVILYNDGGVLTRYVLGTFRADSTTTTFCSSGTNCAYGPWRGHAIGNIDLDPAGKLDIVIATNNLDVVLRNETSVTETGRANWIAYAPGGAGSLMRYQNDATPSGDNSLSVAVDDVDADGDVDVMIGGVNIPVKTYLSNLNQLIAGGETMAQAQANFRLRDAAGSPFGTSTAWSGPVQKVVLEDFDKDGDPDLLITHQRQQDEYWTNVGGRFNSETITVKCGTGRRLPPQTTSSVWQVETLDLDADADLDMVQWLEPCSGCAVPRPLRIYKNEPQLDNALRGGCFVEATNEFFPTARPASGTLGIAEVSQSMNFGDLDGDGYPDAVFAGTGYVGGADPRQRQQTRVYFNVEEGGKRVFRDSTRVRLPNRWDAWTMGAAFADVDADSDLDLFVSTTSGYSQSQGQQQPFFAYEDIPGVGNRTYYRGLADSRVRLYVNDGAGYFTDGTSERLPDQPILASRIVTGDVDNDGDLDLLLPNFVQVYTQINGDYRLWLNDGTGHYTDATYPRLPTGGYASNLWGRAAQLVDMDGDSDLDIVAGGSYGCVRMWLNTGGGFYSDISGTAMPFFAWASCINGNSANGFQYNNTVRDILVSDFDFNGTLDLFLAREYSNVLLLNCLDAGGKPVFYAATGSAPCAPLNAPSIPPGGTTSATMYKRMDGGILVTDVLLDQDPVSGAGRRLWRGSGVSPGRMGDETIAFFQPGTPGIASYLDSAQLFVPLDYDGDGDRDFAYIAYLDNRIMRYAGAFTDVLREPSPFDPFPKFSGDDGRGAIAGDVNGDGWDDLFIMNVFNPRILMSSP